MKKVTIVIKQGKISADFSGFVGKSCETLENKIRPENLNVEQRDLKPEYDFGAENTGNHDVDKEWS